MCGIFGILDLENKTEDILAIQRMSRSLTHRGPDDWGHVFFELKGGQRLYPSKEVTNEIPVHSFEGLLVFGHRRLSVIDLSSAGHQPMSNEAGDIWIVYNGEIYNYEDLTEELRSKGHIFKSKSDCEVILHAYEEWGVECLQHFNGMWAFALWDKNKQRLFCARDRFGIKPFYYFFNGKTFIFASEIKAILQDRRVERLVNDDRVYDYLTYGYIDHSEETFFQNIWQLRGAHYLILEIENSDSLRATISRYWDLTLGRREREDNWKEKFFRLLEDSIRLNMRSDVPVGTCLSGGIDSSSIVCLSKEFLDSNIQKTFSSCFEDKKYDERNFIDTVVEVAHVEGHYVFPKAEDLFQEIENLTWHQDEPFGSTSIYAQWNVFKLAKLNKVKVILDGQGADELLGGYHPYFGFYLCELARTLKFRAFLKEYKGIISSHHHSHFWLISHLFLPLLSRSWAENLKRQVFLNKGRWLKLDSFPGRREMPKRKFDNIFFDELYQSLMILNLPGLLHYEDRNSMAHSIEARVPFLDYRLAEFVFSLPMDQIIRDGTTKFILREAMEGILPEAVRTRQDKMGFVTPQDIWFRGPLKNKIEDILESKSFAERGYFRLGEIKKAFVKHCTGRVNLGSTIWRWVNLEIWLRMFMDPGGLERANLV
jgi:asparagine synthase (glutamine-hydrolysing)